MGHYAGEVEDIIVIIIIIIIINLTNLHKE